MQQVSIFETKNTDLATFLLMEGITLIECTADPTNPKIVIMRFLDEKKNCLDLERVYLNSQCKKFRDVNKWLLKKIHTTLKDRA